MSIPSLEATDKEEESAHAGEATNEHRTAAPSVNVQDSWDRECDVKYVVDRGRDEVGAATLEAGCLEDEDNVVPRY
jgi:hypothetical protein